MLLKRKKITTYKHGLTNLQAKAIMQNNFKLTKKNLHWGANLKLFLNYFKIF